MNICLIGNGLTNLILAKILANKNIYVSLFLDLRKKVKIHSRTTGISKKNLDFINKQAMNISQISWAINYIKIYNESNQKQEILNFGTSKKELFSIFKNNDLNELFLKEIKKNKFIKIKKIKDGNFYESILKNNDFDLIINSDGKNKISKKLFYKKISRNYNSTAFTTIINHKKCNNKIASQVFTKIGPLAFLPCSKTQTSVVFSIYNEDIKNNDKEIKDLIIKYNKIYDINSFSKIEKFNLNFLSLRNYYNKNILSFGDALHKIHPLAGQGLNMIIRDIKVLSDLIDQRIDLGLPLDSSILRKFEIKTKHLNYIFSSGINFIYDFFKIDNKFNNNYSKKVLNLIEKKNLLKKYAIKFADQGILF